MNDLGVVIVAGGAAKRFGGGNKLLLDLGGIPLFCHAIRTFLPLAQRMAAAVPEAELERFRSLAEQYLPGSGVRFTAGGPFRSASVQAGLRALGMNSGIVAVHDAARPLATAELLRALVERARETGGAVPGKPVTDTLQRSDGDGRIVATVERENLWRVETPQVFDTALLLEAYRRHPDTDFTDDAGAFTAAGFPCAVLRSDAPNPKITYPGDLEALARLLAERDDRR